jgi:hypothetical protein
MEQTPTNPKPKSTWWKRLFSVVEIAFAILGLSAFAMVYFTESDVHLYSVLVCLIPAALVRLLRIATTYVVEGRAGL